MTKARKPRPEGIAEELDLRLGGLLGQLGSALTEALSRLEDQGEVHHETTFDSARGPVRASAGIRIRTMTGARAPQASQAARRPDRPVNAPHPDTAQAQTGQADTGQADTGQARARPDTTPDTPSETPPATPRAISATILSDDAGWRLIAELPGVDRSGVSLGQDGDDLAISATGRGRRYEGRFALPAGAAVPDLAVTMQNGILDLSWTAPR